MKNILLTGASGFVGRQVASALLARGHRLRLVLRPGGLARSGLVSDAIEVVETEDLFAQSEEWWQGQMEGIDAIVHAAWYVEPGHYLDSPRNLDCAKGSLFLAEAARKAGIGQFVGIGTCFEYQLQGTHIAVGDPLGPVTLYSAAKLALFRMLEQRFAGSDTAFTWARLFYLFGEGEHPARLFPTLHRQLAAGESVALSSGDKIRDFLDVALAGDQIAGLLEDSRTGAVNICSGEAVTIRQVAERIADLYGRRDLLSFGTAPAHPRDPEAVVGVPGFGRT